MIEETCLIHFKNVSEYLCSNLVEIRYRIFILFSKDKSEEFLLFLLRFLSTHTEEAEPEESEEPFVAPPGLAIPPDVELVSAKISAASWLFTTYCCLKNTVFMKAPCLF